MKKLANTLAIVSTTTFVVAATCLFAAGSAHGQTGEDSDAGAEALAWLAGSWISAEDGVISEEFWTEPRGDSMFGLSRSVSGDDTVFFEFLRISRSGDDITYWASPKGAPATGFKLIRLGSNFVAFENPEHDYPQRIIYRRDGDTMHASISGLVDGREQSSSWEWQRQ